MNYRENPEELDDRQYYDYCLDRNGHNLENNTMLTISDEVLFEQATVAMEEMYGYGCETEIDAYFRGLKWMQKQFKKD